MSSPDDSSTPISSSTTSMSSPTTVSVRRRENWDDESVDRAADVIANLFVHYGAQPSPEEADEFEALRDANYNATLSHIRAHNEDLWVMRVTPDQPIDPFLPGQYTTLALGYWEPRADEAHDNLKPDQDQKMARRSYSVSSSMIDEAGELLPPHTPDVEFYIVKVKPGQEEIPALTPRLFLKGEGDRLYMGRKFTGHYTLEGVKPDDNIVFLSTGTGEAPQNAMIAELLRREHKGRILDVVCVRYWSDLAYTEQHAVLVDRYPSYRYVDDHHQGAGERGEEGLHPGSDCLRSDRGGVGGPPRPRPDPRLPMRKPGDDRAAEVER